MKIVSMGEILWDVFEDAERLGGAPFNFSVHAKRLGHDVKFISAVGADDRGRRALEEARRLGLATDYIGRVDLQPTGYVTIRLTAGGQPDFTIHRPAAYDFVALSDAQLQSLSAWRPEWLYFGTLQAMSNQAREGTRALIEATAPARRLYDVNLRKDSHTPELVHELARHANVLKINEEEVREFRSMFGLPDGSLEEFCRTQSQEFDWEAVCVTCGAGGCCLLVGEEFVEAGGYPVRVADTVGAGDAFAAALVHGLASGRPPRQVADFANRVGALVAARPGALAEWTLEQAASLTRKS